MNRLPFTTALLFCFALPSALWAATPIDQTRPLNRDAELSLDNVKGRIVVEVWERAEVQIRGSLGEGVEALEVEGDASDLKIAVKYPESRGWFGGWGATQAGDSVLLITAPAGIALSIDAVSADVEVRGVTGRELSIEAVSGDIVVDSAAAEIEIDSVSGDQRVNANSADVTVESVSGDIDLQGELTGRVHAETVSGRLNIASANKAQEVHVGVVSGDVELRIGLQPNASLNAESVSGDIEVVVPADTSAKLEVSSFTGSIRSFAGQVETQEYGPGSSLSATLGNGAGRIELESFSGDLHIRSE